MSKKLKIVQTPATEMPAEVTQFAQNSVDQAQAAFDKASDLAHSNMYTSILNTLGVSDTVAPSSRRNSPLAVSSWKSPNS